MTADEGILKMLLIISAAVKENKDMVKELANMDRGWKAIDSDGVKGKKIDELFESDEDINVFAHNDT